MSLGVFCKYLTLKWLTGSMSAHLYKRLGDVFLACPGGVDHPGRVKDSNQIGQATK